MFSEREDKIIKIIGKREMTIKDITSKLFRKGEQPFDPTIAVSNGITRINKKCDYYSLNWILGKFRYNNKLYIRKEKV